MARGSFDIEREWVDVLGRQHYHVVEDVVPTIVVYEVGREPQPGQTGSDRGAAGGKRRDEYGRMSDMLDAMLYAHNNFGASPHNSREWFG